MRFAFVYLFFLLFGQCTFGQNYVVDVQPVILPGSLRAGGREISGLAIHSDRLYFLAENRNDHLRVPSSGVYSVALEGLKGSDLSQPRTIASSQKHLIIGIDTIRERISGYQGLEALAIRGDRFFMTVETDARVDSCYLITGTLHEGRFVVDLDRLLALKKPVLPNGEKVFNAGFEALSVQGRYLYSFFEFNGFSENYAYRINLKSFKASPVRVRQKIPFRLTDTSHWSRRKMIGINYFFPLKAEAIYQRDLSDEERPLIRDAAGALHPFARLVVFKRNRGSIQVRKYIDLPKAFWTSNWEGIVRHQEGVLLVNDKFIEGGGHETQLIYVHLGDK
jgi:hypothetical protein